LAQERLGRGGFARKVGSGVVVAPASCLTSGGPAPSGSPHRPRSPAGSFSLPEDGHSARAGAPDTRSEAILPVNIISGIERAVSYPALALASN
jgi:hypothetical protein